jgi:hypothetical protein
MRKTAICHHNTSDRHGVPPHTTPMGRPDSNPRGPVTYEPDEDSSADLPEAGSDHGLTEAD